MRLFFLATIILTSTVHPSTHDHKAKQEPKPVESAGIVHGVNTHIGIKYFTDHYEDENEAKLDNILSHDGGNKKDPNIKKNPCNEINYYPLPWQISVNEYDGDAMLREATVLYQPSAY